MAILMIEGFDLYNGTGANIGLQSKWNALNWFYGPGITTGRFGGQCYTWTNEGSYSGIQLPTTQNAFTVACAYRVSNVGGVAAVNPRSVIALTYSGSYNFQIGWRPNNDGSISIYRMTSSTAGTLLYTTAAGIILSNVWHFVEFSGTLSTTTGTVVLKVDGVTVANLSAQNTQGYATTALWDGIIIGSAGVNAGQTSYIDDMYVLDSATSLGERRIETIRPNADTAQKDWTPSSGVNNYSRVADATVNSATYVQSSTLNHLDLYDVVDLNGIPTNIDYVQVTAFASKTDAGARSIKLVADLSGTQSLSGDLSLTASIVKYAFGMTTKPGGGSWDASSVNSLKIGPKVSV